MSERRDAPVFDALALERTMAALGSDPEARVGATVPATQSARARPSQVAALPRMTTVEPGGEPAVRDGGSMADLVIEGKLGEGGMGVVRRAHQAGLEREVAVKTVRADRISRAAVEALVDEARINGRLEHPSIVPVYALGRDANDNALLVMKRIDGTAWRDLVRDPSHAAWARLDPGGDPADRLLFHVGVLSQVARALEFAHARGYVHRDLKPENVMVGDFGEVYLLDWGLAAKLDALAARTDAAAQTEVVGTPAFMAPEMLRGAGAHITARTDVYLLGATLHEVLTGEPRHRGKNRQELLYQIFASPPVDYPPAVPEELAALANQATSAEPSARPASAAAFREALGEFVHHRGSRALGRAGAARLGELREAIDAVARAADRDAAREVERLWGECGFAFRQALAMWSGNAQARAGLDAATGAMVAYHLARRDPDTAAALLAGLAQPPAGLAERVEALRAAVASEQLAVDSLREQAHERDGRVAAADRSRLALVAALVTAAVPLGLAAASRLGLVRVTHGAFLAVQLAGMVVMATITTRQRRALWVNAQSRAILALLLSGWIGVLVMMLASLGLGLDVHATVALLPLPLAMAMVGLALFVTRRMFVSVGVLAVAMAVATARPSLALEVIGVGNLVAQLYAARAWRSLAVPAA